MNYMCCICKETVSPQVPPASEGNSETLRLDPFALILVTNIDKDRHEQKEQTFYCHFSCFRRTVNDDSFLYVMDPNFSKVGEVEDEESPDDR